MSTAKESLLNSIRSQGWHLTDEAVDFLLAENAKLNANELAKRALDKNLKLDLRNSGAQSLTEAVCSGVHGKVDSFDADCILQLVKLRNIAAPKENETSQTAPPIYKVTLTDGHLHCNCLIIDAINKLSLSTPPGIKVQLLGSIKIKSSLLILNNSNTTVLGGHVDYLVAKWKANQELSQHVREMNLTSTAPPPWVPFGVRTQTQQVDTTKKALAESEKKEEDGTSEFSQARQAALAEALEAKLKITKTFTQQTVDREGVLAAAAQAPFVPFSSLAPVKKPEKFKKGRKGRFGRDDNNDDDYINPRDTLAMEAAAAKPSTVTLFDAIKLRVGIEDNDQEPARAPAKHQEPERASSYDRRPPRREFNKRGGGGSHRDRDGQNQHGASFETSAKNKQVYNPKDFDFELGDEINAKQLKILEQVKAASTATNTNKNFYDQNQASSANSRQYQAPKLVAENENRVYNSNNINNDNDNYNKGNNRFNNNNNNNDYRPNTQRAPLSRQSHQRGRGSGFCNNNSNQSQYMSQSNDISPPNNRYYHQQPQQSQYQQPQQETYYGAGNEYYSNRNSARGGVGGVRSGDGGNYRSQNNFNQGSQGQGAPRANQQFNGGGGNGQHGNDGAGFNANFVGRMFSNSNRRI